MAKDLPPAKGPIGHAEQVPSMPRHLPTEDVEHPHTSPLRQDNAEPLDPDLPPEPSNDINP